MPRFEPFSALRYAPGTQLDAVTAPPYDVLSDADIAELRARHSANIVYVDVPRDIDGPTRYDDAAQLLATWVGDGIMVNDPSPTFTIYRMRFVDESGRSRRTVGVLGALEVVDEGAPGVLPHERTTPKAKTDRLDLTRATRTNLSPVWGLSLTPGLTAVLAEPGELVGQTTDENGVVHTVERVSDPQRVAAISDAVGANPVLIADGHHRYAISRTYRDECRESAGHASDGAELTLTYVAELVEDQLSIDAIHRIYPSTSADTMAAHLEPFFELSPAGDVDSGFAREVVERGCLCLVDHLGRGTWLTPRAGAFDSVRDLDGAYLEHALAAHDVDVTYQHGVGNVVEVVASTSSACGVLIRPTSIDEIRRTADERLLMPPKSTFFTPKLRTGLVLRPL